MSSFPDRRSISAASTKSPKLSMTGGIELVGWHTPLFASIASVKIIHVLIPKTAAMGRLMGRSAGFYVFLRTWQSPS